MTIKAASDTLLNLCAFRVAGLSVSGGTLSAPPSRLVVAPLGTHDARARGKVIVSAATLEGFAAHQASAKLGTRLALDFEHNTVEGHPSYLADKEPRAIAAWATALAVPGEGLVYDQIEWTPIGLRAWKRRQYQDLSPAVIRRKDGTVIALHSVALCRHGELDGLTIEAAAATGTLKSKFAALSASLENQTDKHPVSPSMKPTPALIALLAALSVNLAADADEAAVDAALVSGAEAIEKLKPAKKTDALSAEQTTEITTLSARIQKMEAAEVERQRAALIAGALAEGKLILLSADVRNTCALNVLEDHIKQLTPGVVPLDKRTPNAAPADKVDTFSAESLDRLAALGITAAEAKAHVAKA